jgi:hypothetical protein
MWSNHLFKRGFSLSVAAKQVGSGSITGVKVYGHCQRVVMETTSRLWWMSIVVMAYLFGLDHGVGPPIVR